MLTSWHEPIDRPVTVSDALPVSVSAARAHLGLSSDYLDHMIEGWIRVAAMYFEQQTGRQLIHTDWQYATSCAPPWRRFIELPRPPLAGDVVITYDDANGDEQTVDSADYVVFPSCLAVGSPESTVIDPYCRRGRIVLAPTASWPSTNGQPESFRVTRRCGYGASPAAMPQAVKQAIYLLVGHYFRNRSEVSQVQGARQGFEALPLGAQALMDPFARSALPTIPDEHAHRHLHGITDPLIYR